MVASGRSIASGVAAATSGGRASTAALEPPVPVEPPVPLVPPVAAASGSSAPAPPVPVTGGLPELPLQAAPSARTIPTISALVVNGTSHDAGGLLFPITKKSAGRCRIGGRAFVVPVRAQHRSDEEDAKMPKITPFLWFDTQAEDAAKFYCSVF